MQHVAYILLKLSSEFITASFSLEKTDVLIDNCLSGLFAFHTSVNLSELALTKANKLVLQDRSSCLPPFLLQLQAGDVSVLVLFMTLIMLGIWLLLIGKLRQIL